MPTAVLAGFPLSSAMPCRKDSWHLTRSSQKHTCPGRNEHLAEELHQHALQLGSLGVLHHVRDLVSLVPKKEGGGGGIALALEALSRRHTKQVDIFWVSNRYLQLYMDNEIKPNLLRM